MLYSGTDPEPYTTEYTLVYENSNRDLELAVAEDHEGRVLHERRQIPDLPSARIF